MNSISQKTSWFPYFSLKFERTDYVYWGTCVKKYVVICHLKCGFSNEHLKFFPPNCGDMREKLSGRFHQDISVMEQR